jgi:hypothetical protein
MNDYPMLHFLVRWGQLVAFALAIIVAAAGFWAWASTGSFVWALIGLVVSAIGYGLALSYVELVKLIIDMLLPKP